MLLFYLAAAGAAGLRKRSNKEPWMHEYERPTHTAPPKMLPSVTGSKFFNKKSAADTWPPRIIPRGTKNKLAMECSNPSMTNAEIGKKIATILLARELDPVAMRMDMHTIQLPITARRNAVFHESEHFINAMLATAGASPRVPPLKASQAYSSEKQSDSESE